MRDQLFRYSLSLQHISLLFEFCQGAQILFGFDWLRNSLGALCLTALNLNAGFREFFLTKLEVEYGGDSFGGKNGQGGVELTFEDYLVIAPFDDRPLNDNTSLEENTCVLISLRNNFHHSQSSPSSSSSKSFSSPQSSFFGWACEL